MYKRYYRHPRTTQERRTNGSRKDRDLAVWRRAKRSASNIPDAWDDFAIFYQKSWKKHRKTQYRSEIRGRKHEVCLGPELIDGEWLNRQRMFSLERYFQDHDIPYKITENRELIQMIEVFNYDEKGFLQSAIGHNGYCFNRIPYYDGMLDDYDYCRHGYWKRKLLGYRVTWWSDKDIGIEYLI